MRGRSLFGPAVSLLVALSAAAGAGAAPFTPPPSPGPQSVGFGYDAAHDFAAADPSLTLPLGSVWSIRTSGDPVALIAADGVVLVLLDTPTASAATGATIEGLDPGSGGQVWSSPAPANAQIAYGSGIVAVAGGGHVQAYNYGVGIPAWNVPLAGVTAVTAADGYFYADSPGTIDAITATTGAVAWTAKPPTPGAAGPLAVAGNAIYRAESSQAEAFNRTTGALLWHVGSAGTAQTPTLWQNDLFRTGFTPGPSVPGTTLDGGPLAAATGSAAQGPAAEIVSGIVGLQAQGIGAVASDLTTGAILWSAYTQPLAILNGDALVAAPNGAIELRNLTTGNADWTATLPSSATTFPTAVGNQQLLVSTAGQLTALAPARYARLTAKITLPKPYAVYGGAAAKGTVAVTEPGIALAQPLQIAAEPWPFKRYGTPQEVATDAAGKLVLAERPSLNTIYRISRPGSSSTLATFKIVALPRITYRFAKRSGTVTVAVPPAVKLAGRRVALYVDATATKRYQLLASGILTGARGRFTARLTAAHSHLPARPSITACVTGIYGLGMSFADGLDRRCGASQIHF